MPASHAGEKNAVSAVIPHPAVPLSAVFADALFLAASLKKKKVLFITAAVTNDHGHSKMTCVRGRAVHAQALRLRSQLVHAPLLVPSRGLGGAHGPGRSRRGCGRGARQAVRGFERLLSMLNPNDLCELPIAKLRSLAHYASSSPS